MTHMGLNGISPMEAERVLLGIVEQVVQKHKNVIHRLELRLYSRVGVAPTSAEMDNLLTFLKSELNTLEVNETANKSLDKSRYDPGAGAGL